jgi:hypothetical protein
VTKGDAIFLKSSQYWKQSIGKCVTLCHPKNQPIEKLAESLDCGDKDFSRVCATTLILPLSLAELKAVWCSQLMSSCSTTAVLRWIVRRPDDIRRPFLLSTYRLAALAPSQSRSMMLASSPLGSPLYRTDDPIALTAGGGTTKKFKAFAL